MKQAIKTIAAVGIIDAVAKTNTASRILDEAAKRTGAAADFLEKIEESIKEEEQ